MNRRLLTILLIAFVIAGVCTFLVYRIVGKRMMTGRPETTTRVVAASSDIKIGTVLTASNLSTVSIVGALPQGAILKPQDAIGRGVIAEIYQGEPILDSRLAAPGMGGGLAPTIPAGMRAIAVKVDQVVGVAGFVLPGMRVDVLASGVPPGAPPTEGPVTKTILQNIKVLSAGTDIQRDAQGKPQQVQVVNLLVTPEEAQTMSLAGNQLKIQLVLRNPLDNKTAPVPITAEGSLLAGAQSARPPVRATRRPAPPPQYDSIQVINGSSTSETRFRAPGGQQ